MASVDFEAEAAAYHCHSDELHWRVPVEKLYPHIPAMLAKARWWLAKEVPSAMLCLCDANVEEIAAAHEPSAHGELEPSAHGEFECSADAFADACYRSVVTSDVVGATVARRRAIVRARDKGERLVDRMQRVQIGSYQDMFLLDGFENLSTNQEYFHCAESWKRDRDHNHETNIVTRVLVRYMRDTLGASVLERAVVITVVRNHIERLLCPVSPTIHSATNWVKVYQDRHLTSRECDPCRFTPWTDATPQLWGDAFVKRFTTPDAYFGESFEVMPAYTLLGRTWTVNTKKIVLNGVKVLLRAGIDPAIIMNAYGRNIFERFVYYLYTTPADATDFIAKLRAVYAKCPEFKFSTLANSPDFMGNKRNHAVASNDHPITNTNESRKLLILVSYGVDIDIANTSRPDDAWKTAQALLAKTRPVGVLNSDVLAVLRSAAQSQGLQTHARTGKRAASCLAHGSETRNYFVHLLAHFCSHYGKCPLVCKIQYALIAFECAPWWSPGRHRYFLKQQRADVIEVILLIARRLDITGTAVCSRLPTEMWYAILSFVRDARIH